MFGYPNIGQSSADPIGEAFMAALNLSTLALIPKALTPGEFGCVSVLAVCGTNR